MSHVHRFALTCAWVAGACPPRKHEIDQRNDVKHIVQLVAIEIPTMHVWRTVGVGRWWGCSGEHAIDRGDDVENIEYIVARDVAVFAANAGIVDRDGNLVRIGQRTIASDERYLVCSLLSHAGDKHKSATPVTGIGKRCIRQ